MKKTIVLDFNNNLICKNCGVTAAVSFINLRTAIDLFMSQHNECKHGDDVITLNEIADIIGISKFNFRNFTNKLNMPEPLPYSKEFGQKKLFNRSVINQWLIDSDVRNLIYKIAAEERRKKNPNTKPYVPRHNKPKKEVVIEEKPLSFLHLFLRGNFDPECRKAERRARVEAARANRPARLVLACIETNDGDLVRRFE